VRQLVLASGAHRPHPYAAAWRALQRRAVALGQLQCGEDHGLALARQFAMLSYRTPEEFGERFDARRRSSMAACAWPPKTISTPPVRSTSRARR
jgi:homoserine acetyltransferase